MPNQKVSNLHLGIIETTHLLAKAIPPDQTPRILGNNHVHVEGLKWRSAIQYEPKLREHTPKLNLESSIRLMPESK
ncbi:uncharacterized protein J3R85_001459 [Psidium guajava]|nr:uncharacterized protein J3R85_001459 [Psidium guajava]